MNISRTLGGLALLAMPFIYSGCEAPGSNPTNTSNFNLSAESLDSLNEDIFELSNPDLSDTDNQEVTHEDATEQVVKDIVWQCYGSKADNGRVGAQFTNSAKNQLSGEAANDLDFKSKLVLKGDRYYLTDPINLYDDHSPLLNQASVPQKEAEKLADYFREFGLAKPMRRIGDYTLYQTSGPVDNPVVRNYVLQKTEEALGECLPDNVTVRNEGTTLYAVYSDKPGISPVIVNGTPAPAIQLSSMVEDLRKQGVMPEIVTL